MAEFTNDYIYGQALRVVEAAKGAGLPMRLLGATAFMSHCPRYAHLYRDFGRQLTDVDLMTYSKVSPQAIDEFLGRLGFTPLRHYVWHIAHRQLYKNEDALHLDVFKDRLEFCHTVEFAGRLELDYPTIPLPEMLLEKLQIVRIAEKDLKDVVILVLEHEIGEGLDQLDVAYVARLLAGDWGFWYTATTNLEKARYYAERLEPLSATERALAVGRLDALAGRIEAEPKTLGWKARAKVGTRKRWYREVEDVVR
jgi:hypothetical protein